ncbi:dihydrolipoyllysine-residue acetyltransferase [Profundibacterium mesophilum]|uniref:Dihydrolipoamide acetyltransferase component of pyruvate dehydrogenase complex n=1 Tax=Profundibacterium mesophilum KAUST100406-0324 TaxID=1037889 RepID=A0A921NYA5_9RHOB|nr:dihydrolipoyllysine-residue acetyltransferase [Profundibacterium mesophilum]KAF0677591.1 pyruvate dehydrogenase E2 component [Profundibacterium mesophilum KAUST100406-0324]
MATEVKVPDIGDFDDVPVITVLVSVGDSIEKEDPLIELESDKATMEVPSSASGTVKEIRVKEGDKVSEGAVILTIEESGSGGSDVDEDDKKAPNKDKEETSAKADTGKSDTGKSDAGKGGSGQPAAPQPYAASQDAQRSDGAVMDRGHGKVHASPSVRAFARTVDVDLAQVNGSGRKGRILREDVMKALKSSAPAAAASGTAQGGMGIPPIPAVDFSKFGSVEDVEMSRIKKLSGPALHRSWLNIPHVTHNEEADITELDAYRKELDTQAKADGYRVTLLSFLVKASVNALKKHWEFNSSIHPDGDKLIRKHYYNIGFAADTPNGLMVPVIKDADRKGITEISHDLMNLSAAARDGKLKGDDMKGATFTISSLGGIGGTSFTPIVNAPEVAILGLTRSAMKPVWNGSEFEPRNMLPMSLSYDHRAIDGALAARFAAHLKYLLGDARRLML